MGYIDYIDSPDGIKGLNYRELYELADEIRRIIIQTTSRRGGHVAPSLGVVELTLALHFVFNSPTDKLIWDVGHQCYAHKLITGRRDSFDTLRSMNGISGFPKRGESCHDIVDTGHSSTSISAAAGLAVARDLRGDDHFIIPIIGDGALTGGLAFEGLNNIGHRQTKRLIVILNDNEMSISQNVGALAQYLNRLRREPIYSRFKGDVQSALRSIPGLGEPMFKALSKFKDGIRHMMVPGALFEELGFKYFGPVPGHDIRELIDVLRYARDEEFPVLIHVLTRKGKGYLPAERDPSRFHGLSPFDLCTGKSAPSGGPTFTEAFSDSIVALAENDPAIVAITAAMPGGTGLLKFASRFADRFFDVGICESHAVTFASGLALQGVKPVVAVYSSFMQRAYDQLIHDVALPNLPVIFAMDRAGLVGEDGPTHHGVFDLGFTRLIPNITVMAPADGRELGGLLAAALNHEGPCVIRYPRGFCHTALEAERVPVPVQWGSWETRRRGTNIAVLACGSMVETAAEAAALLSEDGIEAEIVNARFIKPMDLACLRDIQSRFDILVTLEEGAVMCGFGSAVLEEMAKGQLTECEKWPSVLCLGISDQFITHGTQAELREICGLDPQSVSDRIKVFMNQSAGHAKDGEGCRKGDDASGKIQSSRKQTGQ
ncbi:MAG: 1-deoxy-D-xylulose-5-phosphate synthase [Candidatus Wallbacteria bacterium HGW-Wallbacteria-1]|jgi:1-deoxy-D-xylulose-5-phosphate synthase|uniref:1-deoxy-D-xylulose-5-phosphate synthase n=1 Tax=Candidatus Wallbacteria bacterium HGW-Wallbacteria-1 TaxID=2013854 RepID=A0A2N1PTL3_9BACT|nr:MAG: 1-deoxy-D-xylulose-5-phosphate synthase [Candidatus Wallbacteria bacterium HGW-Wallbacteria-1]